MGDHDRELQACTLTGCGVAIGRSAFVAERPIEEHESGPVDPARSVSFEPFYLLKFAEPIVPSWPRTAPAGKLSV